MSLLDRLEKLVGDKLDRAEASASRVLALGEVASAWLALRVAYDTDALGEALDSIVAVSLAAKPWVGTSSGGSLALEPHAIEAAAAIIDFHGSALIPSDAKDTTRCIDVVKVGLSACAAASPTYEPWAVHLHIRACPGPIRVLAYVIKHSSHFSWNERKIADALNDAVLRAQQEVARGASWSEYSGSDRFREMLARRGSGNR